MPGMEATPHRLRQLLSAEGYDSERIATNYDFSGETIPLAGFYSQPWDTRSACVGVTSGVGDGREAAARCRKLGAPAIFVCCESAVNVWKISPDGPSQSQRIPAAHLDTFFQAEGKTFSPESIYSAKLRQSGTSTSQMWFVDAGLMHSVERDLGETLRRLVTTSIRMLEDQLKGWLKSKSSVENLYRTVFWMLAAKLLHEKSVDGFKRLQLTDVDEVFRRVGRHYDDTERLPPGGSRWRPAIESVAEYIAGWSHLGNVSAESLAYLYETSLIDSESPSGATWPSDKSGLRKDFGIHSTPAMLVDHAVSAAWHLIEGFDPEEQLVFEPACGHAAFLVTAMRWLRDLSKLPGGVSRHRFLRDRLVGIEKHGFARELAKLQLTLADVPHGNSWKIESGDMFEASSLERRASRCTLLLANPPFESFRPKELREYKSRGVSIKTDSKPLEMMQRTLPHLQEGAALALVLPLALMNAPGRPREIRQLLSADFCIHEVSCFADNLFQNGGHESALLIAQRRRRASRPQSTLVRYVLRSDMESFKRDLKFSMEQRVPSQRFAVPKGYHFQHRLLDDLWVHLEHIGRLEDIADVGQGASLQTGLPKQLSRNRDRRHTGVPLIHGKSDKFDVRAELPHTMMSRDESWIAIPRAGRYSGEPQVVMNHVRSHRGPWRIRAYIDQQGCAVTNSYNVIRPKSDGPSALAIWALLISPIANAFVYSTMVLKRHNLPSVVANIPVPQAGADWRPVESAAARYRMLLNDQGDLFGSSESEIATRDALLALDSKVLELYGLSAKRERQLLDLFSLSESDRGNVGVQFSGYFPDGMDAYVPLRELISPEYQRSLAGRFSFPLLGDEDSVLRAGFAYASENFEDE